jgi:eukaryotic-like serine/threonine-protein kinase
VRSIWTWAVAGALWLTPTCLHAAGDIAALEQKAAEGDAAALFALGDRYERGDGVAHDMAMAASYMQLAAEHGSTAAQYRLGLVQAAGLGVQANVTEGYKWLSLAAANGAEDKNAILATALRAKLAARMTPAEVEAGQAEVAVFKPVAGAVALPTSKLAAGAGAMTAEVLQAQLPPGGCGPLVVEAGDAGKYAIAGYLAQGRTASLLAPEVKDLFERHAVELRVTEVEPNLCAALDAIAPTPSAGDSGEAMILRGGTGAEKDSFLSGDHLVIEIPPRDEDRYIAVDYFQHDGQVLHLRPGGGSRLQLLKAKQPLVLADPDWQIGEPFGQDMVVVLTSPRPLFDAERPFLESASDYVADLKARQAGGDVRAQYRIITTAAR